MTTTAHPPVAGEAEAEAAAPGRRRRGLRGRVSAGHLLMLLAGIVAVVGNAALLRATDERVPVLVARADLAAGALLDPTALTTVDIAASDGVLATLVRPDDLVGLDGSVLRVEVTSGDLVRQADLRPAAAPDRRRAMSVPIDASRAVGGRLAAGDRVDVIEVSDGTARFLATDAEVLDVTTDVGSAIGALGGFGVVLAVEAETALDVARALATGSLDVVRSTGAEPIDVQVLPPADQAAPAEDLAADP